ncbi:MAG: anti-sigma factor antagonist [Atopobiaceae bacterium]|nr:anti-sigma factor antagonist [Atopobiaceae bacterium]MBQ3267299.1 anti-sigma factor antagonist [Atopobiaceae bacterium]MBQ3283698.1 anti-sigma factor antagonist [Atopobiaceae bacterium]MBQ6410891.1 anti-sigma factor antagonist [Atopobiaceae bacterium]MBQ6650593.1 anti-sigma factor antagonist [Atopobiaceae bacterium]
MRNSADIVLLPVEEDLDVTTVESLRQTIDALVDGGCRRVILNMSGASFIDSAGMSLLVSEARRMRRAGGLISLVNVCDQVAHALTIKCLADAIPFTTAGGRREVPTLDASVRPIWARTIRVGADGLAEARRWVSSLLSDIPLGKDGVFDLTLASGEALGNAIDHAHAKGVIVSVSGYEDRAVVEVSDCGEGFDPRDVKPAGSCDERGRGIQLMRLLADAVTISPKRHGTGTVVHLEKLVR